VNRDRKVRAVVRALGQPERRKGDELIYPCPRVENGVPCTGARKFKLSVNVATDRFHCWICNWGGKNLVPILRMAGDTPELREYIDELEGSRPTEERTYDPVVLPQEFRSLSTPTRSPYYAEAWEYLRSRGIGLSDALRWRLGYCEDGQYRHRIVVPSFDAEGELNFFVGRSYRGGARSYKHGNFDKDIVWNELMVDWRRPVVVVEGPFDAMKVGENAIALQGSILRSDSRLFATLVTKAPDVYFAMDADASGLQSRIISRLLSYDVGCFWVPLGGRKDVGEMERSEFEARRAEAIRVGSDLDLLKVRVRA
jgi:DNA primase